MTVSPSAGGPVILRICLRNLPVRIRPVVDFHSIAYHFLSKFCSIVWTKSAQPRLYQGFAGLVVFYHIHWKATYRLLPGSILACLREKRCLAALDLRQSFPGFSQIDTAQISNIPPALHRDSLPIHHQGQHHIHSICGEPSWNCHSESLSGVRP